MIELFISATLLYSVPMTQSAAAAMGRMSVFRDLRMMVLSLTPGSGMHHSLTAAPVHKTSKTEN